MVPQRYWSEDQQRRLQVEILDLKQVDLYAMDDAEHSLLRTIIKYLSLIPKSKTCPTFYLQPRRKYFRKSWYMNRPAGVNKLHDV